MRLVRDLTVAVAADVAVAVAAAPDAAVAVAAAPDAAVAVVAAAAAADVVTDSQYYQDILYSLLLICQYRRFARQQANRHRCLSALNI